MAPQRELLDRVATIYVTAERLLETGNEDTIRREVVDKVLEMVNPHFLTNETLRTGGKPDYVFFAKSRSKYAKDLEAAIAVGDAKAPGTDFDRASFGGRSPVRQVYDYMADSETRWGILTDGRRWRLISYESPTDRYFEVDLQDVALRSDTDEWLYFFNLFRREAFVTVGGKCFLDSVKEESSRYAQEVGEELKERTYDALLELAKGFAAWPENNLDPAAPETRERIREGCFVLLYRLLFVFYAEARKLLPVHGEGYRQLSLEAMREEVSGSARHHSRFLRDSRRLWTSIRDLFRLIDAGSSTLGIPPFNGGLFSRGPQGLEHSDFLETNEIADRHLARALDLLGTTPSLDDPRSLVNVDYAGLDIRHLGSIYEGLLEYRLAYSRSDLVSIRRNKKDFWIETSEYRGKTPVEKLPPERKVAKEELYLETDRHERKVTGSYYTPDYVVRYIVLHTLGPIIEEKRRASKEKSFSQAEAVLSVKVCDPAMGSGHFLVAATEFLSDSLLEAIADDQADGLLPQDLTKDEYDLDWAKREIVRHCIYGVDINELAVELTKVSLWLATISQDRPLSFLDHRLKCGNSLIGAQLANIKDYPSMARREFKRERSVSLPDFISDIFVDNLIGKIRELEAIGDDSIEDIRRKERVFTEFKKLPEYAKTRAIANVHTAVYFGDEVRSTERKDSSQVYYDLIYALDFPSDWKPKTKTAWFRRAQETATTRHFFHWELEFPEVFFEGGEARDGGFDAVIGNPPYVRIYRGQISEEDTAYFASNYASAHMKFDLYVLFMELGTRLLRQGGFFGMIVPDKWMSSPYGEPIRRAFLEQGISELVDLRGVQVFKDAAVDNVIPVVRRALSRQDDALLILRGESDDSGAVTIEPVTNTELSVFQQLPSAQIRPEVSESDLRLVKKIEEASIRLGQICYVNWGLRTGTAKKTRDMIGDRKTGPSYKRLIRGVDIDDRYSLDLVSRFIDYDVSRLYNPMFPELFENRKLVFRKISGPKGLMAVVDLSGSYGFSTVIIAVRHADIQDVKRPGVNPPPPGSEAYDDLFYLAALVNSSTIRWHYEMLYSDKLSVVPNQVKEVPIRSIAFNTPESRRSRLLSEARDMYGTYLEDRDFAPWHNFAGLRLAADPEETDIFHDILAFLAQRMTEFHNERRRVVRSFQDWIVSPAGLDADIAEQKIARRIQELHTRPDLGSENGFHEIQRALAQYRVRLTAKRLESLRHEYSRWAQELVKILDGIRATDDLIDFLVFRLYDLSLEEIGLILNTSPEEAGKRFEWPIH
ncbi:MAG: Eco57I restriction-modification methylase domain-containing protein [Thermoplasmata archaeon]